MDKGENDEKKKRWDERNENKEHVERWRPHCSLVTLVDYI